MKLELNDILEEPDPLVAFLRLEELYRTVNAPERQSIRAGWPFDRKWRIPGPCYEDIDKVTFAPLFGVDLDGLDAEARIEARLTYHSIENARVDFRDSTLDLCLCYHAGRRAELDIDQLFDEAAAISEAPIDSMLHRFTEQAQDATSLWEMGFRDLPMVNGVVFEWIGNRKDYRRLKPTR